MSNEIATITDIEKMADATVKSGLFGIKTKEQGIALMLLCQSEGIHPMRAAAEYHIIQGRPALKADAMLARFQRAGGSVRWNRLDDKEVSATFSHPQGGEATVNWTLDMAKNAGLTGKDTWKQYPRQMLRSRVISEGVRTVFPGVATGIYTPEEVADFEAAPLPPKPASGKEGLKSALKEREEPVTVEAEEIPSATFLPATISESQYGEIVGALKISTKDCTQTEKKEVMAEGLRLFSVGSLRDIPADRFEEALAWANGSVPAVKNREE